MWYYYAVTDTLRRNGTVYKPGDQASFDSESPEVALLQSQGVLGEQGAEAPDPTVIDGTAMGLPDRGILPGKGLIHRKEDSDDWQFADDIESVTED
jgi:hypothetical protein